MSWPQNVLIF
uniref:Uncharacterized protein n=1 Tax=Lepeophtheirus salmonis TaxID=72036 RepID=A0A0K2TRW2_LEPSM